MSLSLAHVSLRSTARVTWREVVKSVGLSYFGNLAGCLAVAYFLMHLTELTSVAPYQTYIMGLATKKIYQGWGVALLKGIGCNWMVRHI